MKVFISWSGVISHEIAEALNEWLPCVLQEVKPFLSSEHIHKGAPWFEEIGEQLGETSFGILCLTPHNLESSWILFEAGALSKQVTNKTRVIPLVLGLSPSDLKPPLSNFNGATISKGELHKLIRSLNDGLNEKALDKSKLDIIFEKWWPDLETKLKQAEESLDRAKAGNLASPPSRTTEDMLGELLELTRNIAQRQDVSSYDAILYPPRGLGLRGAETVLSRGVHNHGGLLGPSTAGALLAEETSDGAYHQTLANLLSKYLITPPSVPPEEPKKADEDNSNPTKKK